MAAGLTLTVTARDSILARYGNQLAALSDGQGKIALARALNHEGDKGRTQVKRALVQQTGISYNRIERGLATLHATQGRLTYELRQRGNETNVGLFQAHQGATGVSAAPWGQRHTFGGTWFLPLGGGKHAPIVFHRVGSGRYPIKQVYGPNLAREIVKDESRDAWEAVPASLAARVGHELGRLLPR